MRAEYFHDDDRFDMTICNGKWWDEFADSSKNRRGGLNRADWDINKFVNKNKNRKGFKHTIAIILAAHGWNAVQNFIKEMEL